MRCKKTVNDPSIIRGYRQCKHEASPGSLFCATHAPETVLRRLIKSDRARQAKVAKPVEMPTAELALAGQRVIAAAIEWHLSAPGGYRSLSTSALEKAIDKYLQLRPVSGA